MAKRDARVEGAILDAVLELLHAEGYDGVRMRAVVDNAHVSLRTVYRYFPTREELIVAAMERWMAQHAYVHLAELPAEVSLYEGLLWTLNQVFEPWVQNPEMLRAFHRAQTGPGGGRLKAQGFAAVGAMTGSMVDRLDPAYLQDLSLILGLAVLAVVGQCADGDLESEHIVPLLERVVFRLTNDNTAEAAAAF